MIDSCSESGLDQCERNPRKRTHHNCVKEKQTLYDPFWEMTCLLSHSMRRDDLKKDNREFPTKVETAQAGVWATERVRERRK